MIIVKYFYYDYTNKRHAKTTNNKYDSLTITGLENRSNHLWMLAWIFFLNNTLENAFEIFPKAINELNIVNTKSFLTNNKKKSFHIKFHL